MACCQDDLSHAVFQLWWDRFQLLAGKMHRKFVGYVLLCVPMSVWTDISSECSLRSACERDRFRFSPPVNPILSDRCVWITNPPCGGRSLGC